MSDAGLRQHALQFFEPVWSRPSAYLIVSRKSFERAEQEAKERDWATRPERASFNDLTEGDEQKKEVVRLREVHQERG
eukprot:scaffold265327_cov31-Tisochrysis_lutea.AAC.4